MILPEIFFELNLLNVLVKNINILKSLWARLFYIDFQKILDVRSNMLKAYVCCSIVGSLLTKFENSLNLNGLNLMNLVDSIDLCHICYQFSY